MMKKILIIIGFALFYNCQDPKPKDNTPPEMVQIVEKSAEDDTLQFEKGIDALPGSEGDNRIQVMWRSHPQLNEVEQFRVYRSIDPMSQINFNIHSTIDVDNPYLQDTVFIDGTLEVEKRYSYYITAVDKNGNESDPSIIVWYELMSKAQLIYPTSKDAQTFTRPKLAFKWRFNDSILPNQYILRIERNIDIGENFFPLMYVKYIDTDYSNDQQIDSLSGDWVKNVLPYKGEYRWRIDSVGSIKDEFGILKSGSESEWETFSVNWSN